MAAAGGGPACGAAPRRQQPRARQGRRPLHPELTTDDVLPGPPASAPRRSAATVASIDDFVVSETERALHVRNAPSPAATSSLALARLIADRVHVKVLVTGHDGYIGTVLTPLLTSGRARAGRARHRLLRRPRVLDPPESPRARPTSATSPPRTSTATRPSSTSRRSPTTPSATSTQRSRTRSTTTPASSSAQAAREAGVTRFLYSSSCSTYGAGDTDATARRDARRSTPSRPTASRSARRARHLELATPSFSPVHLRNATAYGVSPRMRGDIVVNNLVAYAYATGEVRMQSDGTPWRRSPTWRTSREPSWRRSTHRPSSSTTRRSTSAATRTTTRSATSPA